MVHSPEAHHVPHVAFHHVSLGGGVVPLGVDIQLPATSLSATSALHPHPHPYKGTIMIVNSKYSLEIFRISIVVMIIMNNKQVIIL